MPTVIERYEAYPFWSTSRLLLVLAIWHPDFEARSRRVIYEAASDPELPSSSIQFTNTNGILRTLCITLAFKVSKNGTIEMLYVSGL